MWIGFTLPYIKKEDQGVELLTLSKGFIFLIWFFTSQSTIFSVMLGWASWDEPVLRKDKCALLKDKMQWCRWGSNRQPLGIESSTLPLCHGLPEPKIATIYYPPTKWEEYSFGIIRASVNSVRPSTLFVCPEPYLSTYWSDLIHSSYKWLVPWQNLY